MIAVCPWCKKFPRGANGPSRTQRQQGRTWEAFPTIAPFIFKALKGGDDPDVRWSDACRGGLPSSDLSPLTLPLVRSSLGPNLGWSTCLPLNVQWKWRPCFSSCPQNGGLPGAIVGSDFDVSGEHRGPDRKAEVLLSLCTQQPLNQEAD